MKLKSDSPNRTRLANADAEAAIRKEFDEEPKDWLVTFFRPEDPPRINRAGTTASRPTPVDRRTLPNVGPYEPIIKKVPLAPYQTLPYSAAHGVGDAVRRFSAWPSTPQPQSEEGAFRFDDLPNGKRTGGAAVSGPASPNRQTEVNVGPFDSAHKTVPFVSYQNMPYSAARLSGRTFEDQGAPVLRFVPQPQDDHVLSVFPPSPMEQGSAASSATASSDDTSNPLKMRSIIQAVGSRGLFPMQ